MEIGTPNEHGVINAACRERVARHGRAYAAVRLALCEDGLYRYGVEMHYSYGGFSTPISIHAQGFVTLDAARTAALEQLLRHWHMPFSSDPQSVHQELHRLREQVEVQLRQPSLF